MTRRRFLGLASGAGLLSRGFFSRAMAKPSPCLRQYRAHATVILLSFPIISKSDVGSGYILIEEAAAPGNTTAIQFGAGSWPEAARGLNRLGLIREEITERTAGIPEESAYFAFMTSSQEENLDQAKKALEASGNNIPYAAAEGRGRDGRFVSQVNHICFPSQFTWRDCPQLIDKVRDAVASGAPTQRIEKTLAANELAPATFLYAVRKAILDPAPVTTGSLIYNGREFRLRTTKEADEQTGARLVAKNIAQDAGRVIRLNATLREYAAGHETPFKVWYESGSEHLPPLCFEYQARSFLRLTFEFDRAAPNHTADPAIDNLALKNFALNQKEPL